MQPVNIHLNFFYLPKVDKDSLEAGTFKVHLDIIYQSNSLNKLTESMLKEGGARYRKKDLAQ